MRQRVLDTMAKERVTVTNLVPTMLNGIVNCPAGRGPVPGFPPGDERRCADLAEPRTTVIETFDCEYVQTYGLTETSPYLTFSLLADHHRELPLQEQMRPILDRPAGQGR